MNCETFQQQREINKRQRDALFKEQNHEIQYCSAVVCVCVCGYTVLKPYVLISACSFSNIFCELLTA